MLHTVESCMHEQLRSFAAQLRLGFAGFVPAGGNRPCGNVVRVGLQSRVSVSHQSEVTNKLGIRFYLSVYHN